MKTRAVSIKNLVNQQDADKVLEALERVWGIGNAEVKLSQAQAVVTYDERMASLEDVEQAIVESGYEISR